LVDYSSALLETERMRAVAIIPARMASTRLPGKPMRLIAGRPMIEHVYRAVQASSLLAEVVVATDAPEILEFCRAQGFRALLTSDKCRSGTDRVHEAAQTIAADVYVNVQGDEPLTRPQHIAALLKVMQPQVQVGTLKTPLAPELAPNPHIVKVVADRNGRALYFSRLPLPFDRDGAGASYYKHLGFYAYTRGALDRFVRWPEAQLERTERLEQLRFLENGVDIYVAETPHDTVGVDTEEDLKLLERMMAAK
jgi:3-deoxy-manno-octulosonate cytidylyltransferase (CMP-KDO synthetase)